MCATSSANPKIPEGEQQKPWRPWEVGPKCSLCNTFFKRDSELKRHKTSKHSKKREKCPMCTLEFTRKDNLTRHIKLAHTSDDKPHCRWCSKRLSRKDAVQRHESTCPKNLSRQSQSTSSPPTTEADFRDLWPSHIERLKEKMRKSKSLKDD